MKKVYAEFRLGSTTAGELRRLHVLTRSPMNAMAILQPRSPGVSLDARGVPRDELPNPVTFSPPVGEAVPVCALVTV